MNTEERYLRRGGPVNKAFGLTYASWFVVPRTFLMDMPIQWLEAMHQRKSIVFRYHLKKTESFARWMRFLQTIDIRYMTIY